MAKSGPTKKEARLRAAAEAGDAEAQYALYQELTDEHGGAHPEANTWLDRAAALGHGKALRTLGFLFEVGRNRPQDTVKALECYRGVIAAGLGDEKLGDKSAAQRAKALESALARRAQAAASGKAPDPIADAIDDAGLGKRKKAILALELPSIRWVAAAVEDGALAPTASKLGGRPALPKGFAWPVNERAKKGKRPLDFLAQIDLAAAHAAGLKVPLPKDGALVFFYDCETMPWGRPGEGGYHVAWVRGARVATPAPKGAREVPPSSLRAEVEATLPFVRTRAARTLRLSDDDGDAYLDLLGKIPGSQGELHRSFGHADAIQGDMARRIVYERAGADLDVAKPKLEKECDAWELLLQVDSYRRGKLYFGDAGRLFFWGRREQLAKGDVADVALQLQCH